MDVVVEWYACWKPVRCGGAETDRQV